MLHLTCSRSAPLRAWLAPAAPFAPPPVAAEVGATAPDTGIAVGAVGVGVEALVGVAMAPAAFP